MIINNLTLRDPPLTNEKNKKCILEKHHSLPDKKNQIKNYMIIKFNFNEFNFNEFPSSY